MSLVRLKQLDKIIIFGNNSTLNLLGECKKLNPYKICLLTDNTILDLYSDLIEKLKNELNIDLIYVLKTGEEWKNIDTVIEIWKTFISHGFTRRSLIIAFGGGVINDLAGFIASTFMRGIYYMNIPTTLLSQADACIGGKNGIDFYGKNIIGTVYLPDVTIIDPQYILTLSDEEIINGIVEIIKHGLISDPSLIEFIKLNHSKILDRDLKTIERIILNSVKIKLGVISKDLLENGYRRVLNLGHTVGHAIESLSNYKIPHGKAVSQGIMVSMKIGEKIFNFNETEKIKEVLELFNLPVKIHFTPQEIIEEIKKDKKSWYGNHVFIIPSKIGDVRIVDLHEDIITEVLSDLYEDMSIHNS